MNSYQGYCIEFCIAGGKEAGTVDSFSRWFVPIQERTTMPALDSCCGVSLIGFIKETVSNIFIRLLIKLGR